MKKDWVQVLVRFDGKNEEEMRLYETLKKLIRMTGSARGAVLILVRNYIRKSGSTGDGIGK